MKAVLNISNNDFKEKLDNRIKIGEEIFSNSITTYEELNKVKSKFEIWSDYNLEMLMQVFNISKNNYWSSYDNSGYGFMGQLDEVEGNPAMTLKNLIQYKLENLRSLLAKSELIKTEIEPKKNITNTSSNIISKSEVFIVHGHDEVAKTKTARLIERLGLKPIILHEQASGSKTVIEKIETYSNVGFGIVLYTPCDLGAKSEKNPVYKNRARQNVVFEHGFLIGKIGRENVCALVKDDVETPNDISGVVYVKMDNEDAWHIKVARELRNSGYDIDMNKL